MIKLKTSIYSMIKISVEKTLKNLAQDVIIDFN